jgi:hypothetical protein
MSKPIIAGLSLLMAVFLLNSCKKDGTTYEVVNPVAPEFHVVVVTDDNNVDKVPDATVTLYKTQDDLENNSNVFLTKQTESNGEAVFTKDELKDPGVYYVRASKNTMIGTKESQYLLLNDGKNYLFVKIQ